MLSRLVPLLLLYPLTSLPAAEPPGHDEWKFDGIHRKAGVPLRGLVLKQGADSVKIRCVSRKPGSPTVTFLENVPRKEIARVELLGKEDRARLEQRLAAVKRDYD